MKNLRLSGFCLSLIFACFNCIAQNEIPLNEPDLNKPKLFTDLPDKISMAVGTLQSLLGTAEGKDVSMNVGEITGKNFTGKVISAASKYNNIHSVVIRSSNFNGATLTLSSSIQSNGAVKFTGRIMSIHHGDLYELINENGQYFLIKKKLHELMNE